MRQDDMLVVTIVGGGASAHVLIPFLSSAGHRVQLLTRRPGDWSREVELELQSIDGDLMRTFSGEVARISDDPADVIPLTDVVVLCMPVHQYRVALHDLVANLPLHTLL